MPSPDLQTAHCQRRCDGGGWWDGQRGGVTEERYGPQTVAVIAELQRRAGVTGPDADGTIVGPRTWAAPKSHRDDCVTAG
jgi:peptidoglycan hydrolase-like protein with peptidoglycan-binding domain